MYQSHFHLIPISYTSPSPVPRHRRPLPGGNQDSDDEKDHPNSGDEYLGPADALRLLRDPSVNTLAPLEVEMRAWERIQGYTIRAPTDLWKNQLIISGAGTLTPPFNIHIAHLRIFQGTAPWLCLKNHRSFSEQ